MLQLSLGSSFSEVDRAIAEIEDYLVNKCSIVDSKLVCYMIFSLRELLNNSVEHGNKFDAAKQVVCCLSYAPDGIVITVEDEGNGFNLEEIIHSSDNMDLSRERCRGLACMLKMGFRFEVDAKKLSAYLKLPLVLV